MYGLVGYPLSHSFSKAYFEEKFRNEFISELYGLFPIENVSQLGSLLLAHPELKGLNVTLPYKEQVLPFLHHVEKHAAAIGAVNCIRIADGVLTGYNTDHIGFRKSLQPLMLPHDRHALVLGTGGAAKAVAYALQLLNVGVTFVSRKKNKNHITYRDLTEVIVHDHSIVINTTPLGTFPHTEAMPPFCYQWLTPEHLCYDLIYNPAETLFLKKASEKGARVKNGYEMLIIQAEESWKIWNAT